MYKRILILLASFALSTSLCVGVHSAPAVAVWELMTSKVVYQDTLPYITNGVIPPNFAFTDSSRLTDSVAVFGARCVMVVAQSTGSDSIAVMDSPTIPGMQCQSNLTLGQWSGAGGAGQIPFGGGITLISSSGPAFDMRNKAVGQASRVVWIFLAETTIPSSTPDPLINQYFRWRVRSTNIRRAGAGGVGGSSPTGTITLTAYVWR